MPVVDGILLERTPLTAAEQTVDFVAHNTHIVDQRVRVEDAARPKARRIVVALELLHGLTPQAAVDDLAAVLARELDATAAFGYHEASREIHQLRHGRPALAFSIADVGEHGRLARRGLDGIRTLVARRATEAAIAVASAAAAAAAATTETGVENTTETGVEKTLAVTGAALWTLHNNVLELVGETLNMGRTAGALDRAQPPEFAMRSEQLDGNTCDGCEEEHGGIYEVDSPEFYDHMPPANCFGGGRCRGIYVFGDTPADMTLEQAA